VLSETGAATGPLRSLDSSRLTSHPVLALPVAGRAWGSMWCDGGRGRGPVSLGRIGRDPCAVHLEFSSFPGGAGRSRLTDVFFVVRQSRAVGTDPQAQPVPRTRPTRSAGYLAVSRTSCALLSPSTGSPTPLLRCGPSWVRTRRGVFGVPAGLWLSKGVAGCSRADRSGSVRAGVGEGGAGGPRVADPVGNPSLLVRASTAGLLL